MDSVYYSKTVCERCINNKCSQYGRRNIHMNKKNFKCSAFIDPNKQYDINKEDEYEIENGYSPFDGMW